MTRRRTTVPTTMRPTYAQIRALWRAGHVADFYYGRNDLAPEPIDGLGADAHVWNLRTDDSPPGRYVTLADDKAGRAQVRAAVAAILARAELADAREGRSWMGWAALELVRVDGSVVRTELTSRGIVRSMILAGEVKVA